jgi:hypothetical protein
MLIEEARAAWLPITGGHTATLLRRAGAQP